ncbi:MAG: hypothetical protein WCH57_06575 [Verrucomicrobiota bacterium]
MASPLLLLRRRERAAALIVVLAFVVLLAGVAAAYFSRAVAHRRLSSSSFHQAMADELARSALDILVGGLKQEIAAGSSASTVGGATLYLPNGNAAMAPVRNVSDSAMPTLLRISATGTLPAPGADFAASDASSTGTSANGRTVTLSRWNRHYLVRCANPGTPTDTTPIATFSPPRWVFVTDHGPAVLASPTSTVLARYAYALYDEGALLDANVAGYPSAATAAQYGPKGSLAYADLTALGISGTGVNNIVGWRNYASLQPQGDLSANFTFTAAAAAQYNALAASNTNGFLKVSGTAWNGRTDQAFASRQALIAFSRASKGSVFPPSALQYLGTFSRAVTAPPAFASVRLSTGGTLRHYHDDGTWSETSVAAGDPLLQSRFSLGKLAWITPSGTPPCGISAAMVQACFGLQWNAAQARWDYVGSTGGSLPTAIQTLEEIASEAAPREANFFELLKAGIDGGSLGQDPVASSKNPDFQLIQIGANIIDQSDADNAPTAIYLSCAPPPGNSGGDLYQTAFGVESLPASAAQSILPMFLNRPLRSVGELGYIFRDLAFNTLDFCSAHSADAGLLDLFSTMEEPPVIAGQINPNRASVAALQAILAGTTKDEASGLTLSSDEAKTIAAQLAAQISNSPLRTRAGLIPALSSLPSVRALAPVTNLRTWNLMVDLIAQTGVFPPGARTLDQFVVQGERRYWLHVAIDRFTGNVVDQQLEPVFE